MTNPLLDVITDLANDYAREVDERACELLIATGAPLPDPKPWPIDSRYQRAYLNWPWIPTPS